MNMLHVVSACIVVSSSIGIFTTIYGTPRAGGFGPAFRLGVAAFIWTYLATGFGLSCVHAFSQG